MSENHTEGSHNISNFLDQLPVESFGACINYQYNKRYGCKAHAEVLGDGLCMRCWDRNTPTRAIRDNKDRKSMWARGSTGRIALDNDSFDNPSSKVKRKYKKGHMKFI